MSAIFWHYKHYDFVYVIDINIHVFLFLYYYIVVPFTQFWTTSRLKKLVDCRCIWHIIIIFQVTNATYQKVSAISWKINITVCFFVFFCWTFVTRFFIHIFYCIYFHCPFLNYEYLIISRIKNKQILICYFNLYFSVGFS